MGMYGNCGSFSGNRGFLTRGEKIEMLSDYKKNLEKEAKGVAELIQELEKNN